MKRIILVFLVFSCIRFSYAEELTAEQQKLAWKFILSNLLSNDNQPSTFKKDILINLRGEITSQDSLFVKKLIPKLQSAIPYLKIELSQNPGNLILGLNDGKLNTVNVTINGDHELQSVGMYYPVPLNLSNYERTQYIYSQLFQGLTFFSGSKKQTFNELKGCVFKEKDFKAITISPFDLFILEKLYAPDFSIQLARNLSPELQQTAWSSILTKFMGETTEPIIYRNDIAIKLEGKVSLVDTTCMNELIDQLQMIIPNRKIFLTTENANLVFNLLDPASGVAFRTSSKRMKNSIQLKNFDLSFTQNTSKEDRKRTLYFNLMRSLVDFSPSRFGSTEINGCVFDEKKPESITYQPVDAFIVNTLYSDDFKEQYKNQFIRLYSYRLYLVQMYRHELDNLFFTHALLFPIIFLTWLILKGAFKPHCWNWKEFNKQGIYLIAIWSIYSLIISASDLQLNFREISLLFFFDLKALLAVNLIFFTERFILENRNLGGSKVIVIFLVTLIFMTIASFEFTISYFESGSFVKSFTSKESFSNILLFSLARSLYIFLNDRYKSIINQKDVELAQMGEFQKQAELQSLRAKINPHFLYNALNSIASLATTDARKTEQMALALSDFFKYAINREQKQLNTLFEELNAIRTYLEIEKVRFGDRLSFEIDCPEDLLNIQIPQLLIQPLVENAIKHGLSQITENGLIGILVSKEENQLKIRVYDNGPAFPKGPLSGFGIQNTQERIALLYGAKATINWQNGAEKYIEISIPV